MRKEDTTGTRKKIALAAVLVGVLLSFLTVFFVKNVKKQLWDQSVSTIMESTQQGCNTLRVQLLDDYDAMDEAVMYMQGLSMEDRDQMEEALKGYAQLEDGISLYLENGACIPADAQDDLQARRLLAAAGGEKGIISPHISSVSGVNVFDLFRKVVMRDGTRGWLVKEYEVDSIVDSFSLTFYNGAGFSYVVNAEGDILIRSPHPDSNKTIKNLFDILGEPGNSSESLAQFKQSLADSCTGWAVFDYQGEGIVFCYTPLELNSDWYLISMIPKRVVGKQTNEILWRALVLIVCIILGIVALVAGYMRYAIRINRKLSNQANYIGHLYNAVPDGIALIAAQIPHQFLQLNREGLRLLGYPEDSGNDAPRGRLLRDVIFEEDFEPIRELFESTAGSEQKNIFECRMKRKAGDIFWAGGILEKMLDENGEPVLIAAFHDITNEKLEEEAKARETLQERFTLVGALSNAYPVIVNLNLTRDTLNFIYVKQGLMLELGKQKSYSELYEDMLPTVHPDHLKEFKRCFSPENLRTMLGRETNEFFLEVKQMLTDGQYHWTSSQIIYVNNLYSQEKLAILISRRVDEQRYKEERQRQALQSALDGARAASNAKSQFLSNMSHDIRTPMNAIIGMTAIASAHLDDRERVEECLKKISLSSKHLLSLINDVLDMSKIESGKLSLRKEPFNFAGLVADCVELVRTEANAKKLQVEVCLSVLKDEDVVGDALCVRQVCINILSNAVKYTPEGGSVQVAVRQEASRRKGYQRYVFCCSDNGIGMSRDFLERLFLPFERGQDSTGSKIVGTGLGMAITRNLVDLMNGEIQVESEPGRGSVFTVTLPLRLRDAYGEEIPQRWKGAACLIVDDDRQECENTAVLFEDLGFRTKRFTDGKAAAECAAGAKGTSEAFRLAVIARSTADMDGVEAAARIRTAAGEDGPVIMFAAYEWSGVEKAARAAGVTAFLSKPLYRLKICDLLNGLDRGREEKIEGGPVSRQDYSDKRILLVEDNEINREIARELLNETGGRVEEACDGVEAVRMVEESPEGYYDLILMDVQMPRMDGYEATKAIRALKRSDAGGLPIVAMTANAFDEDVRIALRAGMNAHLAKPVDMEELEKTLYRYLAAPTGKSKH